MNCTPLKPVILRGHPFSGGPSFPKGPSFRRRPESSKTTSFEVSESLPNRKESQNIYENYAEVNMKITDVKSFVTMPIDGLPWHFVEVHTDEGVTGLGECSLYIR